MGSEGEVLEIASIVEDVAVHLLKLATTSLPADVREALEKAYQQERSPLGKTQLGAILENIKLAEEEKRPICQDTGIINFYLKVSPSLPHLDGVESALRNAVVRATREVPLRPNAVDPFTEVNTGDNTGMHIPSIHWRFSSEDCLEIIAFPKGGGSENVCALAMMTPSDGRQGMRRFIVESVVGAGAMPCPPTIIGVGIGGGADIAMELAKMALLRPLNEPHRERRIAKLERDLYEAVNSTQIGPMGLGGDSTTLGVKINYAHRHPASYPVAVAFQCWAARRSAARVFPDGRIEYLTHKVSQGRS
jgi:fumarate hydratase subunit alpha